MHWLYVFPCLYGAFYDWKLLKIGKDKNGVFTCINDALSIIYSVFNKSLALFIPINSIILFHIFLSFI